MIGIGSPHGDDGVGWVIARRAAERLGNAWTTRCARTPVELLDALEGIATLDVCDALVGQDTVGTLHCWHWPAPDIERAPFCGTHDLSLPQVLALADALGRLPPTVRIWGVAIDQRGRFDALSSALASAMPAIVDQICKALNHA